MKIMKTKRETVKEKIMKKVVDTSERMAVVNANSACAWWLSQPKVPEKVKKLRKF